MPSPRWIIKGTTVYYGGEPLAELVLDSKATPPCIDLVYRSPKVTYEGIYAIEDKTLKICVNREVAGVKDRPQDFATTELPNRRLLIFEREEPREGAQFEGVIPFIGVVPRVQKGQGVVIAETQDDSTAARAGLKKGDLILKIGTTEVNEDATAVLNIIRGFKPGTEVAITIKRDGKEQQIKVKVGVLPFRF
jgi:C-terminal processing protease CtpA/Prc